MTTIDTQISPTETFAQHQERLATRIPVETTAALYSAMHASVRATITNADRKRDEMDRRLEAIRSYATTRAFNVAMESYIAA